MPYAVDAHVISDTIVHSENLEQQAPVVGDGVGDGVDVGVGVVHSEVQKLSDDADMFPSPSVHPSTPNTTDEPVQF